jgi:hypothetical protein
LPSAFTVINTIGPSRFSHALQTVSGNAGIIVSPWINM